MKVTVIVLNYNGLLLLGNCLTQLHRSLKRYSVSTSTEIIVVDNASTQSPRPFLKEKFPTVRLIENHSNVGFGAGNNVGIRQSDSEIVVLVNPDVVVDEVFLSNLLAPFSDPSIGIVGCKLHYPDGEIIQHAGGYLVPPRALPNHFGVGEIDRGQYDTPREVEYVIGAAIGLRRAMLDEIGLFDEAFFLFFEEVDLCFRARAAGWKVWYEPMAVATHIESATVGKHSFFYYQQFHKARLQFVLKHFSADQLPPLVAAEIPHLAKVSNLERLALQLAYQHALAIADSEFLRLQMRQLLAAALQPAGVPALKLTDITPRPFRSKWSLIARFRDLWSRVAVRPYAQAHFVQQVEFNRLIAAQIVENDRLIEEQRMRIGQLSAEITSLDQHRL